MEMRDVLSIKKSGETVPSSPVSPITRHRPDNLDSVSVRNVENRASTNSVNSHTINEVIISSSGTNTPSKEAEGVGFNSGESKPSNLGTNFYGLVVGRRSMTSFGNGKSGFPVSITAESVSLFVKMTLSVSLNIKDCPDS